MSIVNDFIIENLNIIVLSLLSIIVILIILSIISLSMIIKLKKKYSKFMQGKNANSLEKDIMELYEDNKFVKTGIETNRREIKKLKEKQKTNFQKMGLAKYDAFKELGGKLSFALALLDENNDGFIINSVHSSDGCYSYTKRIKNGSSEIDLSNEEKVAVERAMKGTASNPNAE